jgi:hypothetical protein
MKKIGKQSAVMSALEEAYSSMCFGERREKLEGEFTSAEMLQRRLVDDPTATRSMIRHHLDGMIKKGLCTARIVSGIRYYKLNKP